MQQINAVYALICCILRTTVCLLLGDDCGERVRVYITAGKGEANFRAAHIQLAMHQRGDTDRTRGFDEQLHAEQQEAHRRFDLRVVDEQYSGKMRLLDRKGEQTGESVRTPSAIEAGGGTLTRSPR